MKNLLLCIILLIFTTLAGEKSRPTYSGGMYYQAGYHRFSHDTASIDGISTGLGGLLTFYITDHFAVGSMGGSAEIGYDDDESYYSLGYGGVTLRYWFTRERVRFTAGTLIGGGRVTLLDVASRSDSEISGTYRKVGSLLFSPVVSGEFLITPKIAVMTQIDYFMGPNIASEKHLGGPKIQLGVLFSR
jgi:hypothetical protein